MISLAIETFHSIKWQKFRNGPYRNIHSSSETDEQSLRNTLKDENQFFLTQFINQITLIAVYFPHLGKVRGAYYIKLRKYCYIVKFGDNIFS